MKLNILSLIILLSSALHAENIQIVYDDITDGYCPYEPDPYEDKSNDDHEEHSDSDEQQSSDNDDKSSDEDKEKNQRLN